MLVRQLSGAARTLTLSPSSLSDAYLQHATRLVHGYFEMRAGKLHFEVQVEDAVRHKMLQVVAADGDLVAAMRTVATALAPGAGTFATNNDNAIAAWSKGDFAEAVKIDPNFGPAWVAWSEQLARSGNALEALATAQRGLAQEGLKSPSDRAQLQVLAAGLQNDPAARLAGLHRLAQLLPADPAIHRSVADAEMQARHFAQAAAAYKAAVEADPSDSAFLNLLGYAQAFAGDMDGARRSFEAYGRMPDQGINALDSLGEALFMNGKFQEAAQQFLEAHAKNPAFLGGETLWKAAHARWLGGDLPAADTLAKDFFDQRAKMHDPLLDWHRANWLYETGRRDEAVAVLTNAAPLPGDLAHKQLAVWADPQSVPRDLIALKRAYETTAPTDDGVVRTFYAAALLQAGQREEADKLVALWPLPKSQDALQALMYPAFQAVRKATAPPH
ncbi:MAG TPA: hypothetical protein VGN17_20795 [Bryobacteraceae bacterium]|jgi:tetratricopeptide (TPR) repeat protein